MIKPHVLEAWLSSTNARYRAEDMPARQRPFRALSDFSREFKCSFAFDAPIARSIFDWFYKNSAPDSHAVGALFTGAFYFDAYFWPLRIPLGYGTFSLNALDCLETMPDPVKASISQSHDDFWTLALYWADCCDYGYGVEDIRGLKKLDEKAAAFLNNADRELNGAISQLTVPRPNPKAILALRMSCEIFLKVLLIQERKLNDDQLRKLGHNIEDIAAECFSETGVPEFEVVGAGATTFPAVSERYDGHDRKLSEVWEALCVTQIAATAVIRRYTDRDMRAQIYSHGKEAT